MRAVANDRRCLPQGSSQATTRDEGRRFSGYLSDPLAALSCATVTDRCIVCDETLVHGYYFALPWDVSERARWAYGLFPNRPYEYNVFITNVTIVAQANVPYVCFLHFNKKDVVLDEGRPVRLFLHSIPIRYDGSMTSRQERMARRYKCIVCGALRPSDEMYPFTQKKPLLSKWCKSLYPFDKIEAHKLSYKVARSVTPTLCAEHFSRDCFDAAHDLKANSIPTMVVIRQTANVMNMLIKARADLDKVLPGDFIPRANVWDKMEKDAGYDKKGRMISSRPEPASSEESVSNEQEDVKDVIPMQGLVKEEEEEPDSKRIAEFDAELARQTIKAEALVDCGPIIDTVTFGAGSSHLPIDSFAQDMYDNQLIQDSVSRGEFPPKMKRGRPKKNISPQQREVELQFRKPLKTRKLLTKTGDSPKKKPGRPRKPAPPPPKEDEGPPVVTKSGRLVKRKKYVEAERKERIYKKRVRHPTMANGSVEQGLPWDDTPEETAMELEPIFERDDYGIKEEVEEPPIFEPAPIAAFGEAEIKKEEDMGEFPEYPPLSDALPLSFLGAVCKEEDQKPPR